MPNLLSFKYPKWLDVAIATVCTLPGIAIAILVFFVIPDIEAYLCERDPVSCHRLSFENLNNAASQFAILFLIKLKPPSLDGIQRLHRNLKALVAGRKQ